MDLIIKENDSRFKFLNKLWNNYSWDNLVSDDGPSRIYYFIPPELVLKEEIFVRGYSLFDSESKFLDDWSNWFSSKIIDRRLRENCNLNNQDYFDLLILKINDRDLRPKCDNCNGLMPYSGRIYYGYNTTLRWIDHNHHFCSKSCSAKYEIDHYEEFGYSKEYKYRRMMEGADDPFNKTYHDFICWMNLGDENDHCCLYLAEIENRYKFGVTSNPDKRSSCFYQNLLNLKVIYEGTRLEVGLLESNLKLSNNGSEYHDDKSYLLNLINDLLAKRPLVNPFE